MNAVPNALLSQAAALSETVTAPIAGSRKIHVRGSRDDVAVPMREIVLDDTPSMFGAEKNAPFVVYDTSGPYTDPAFRTDLAAGLPALRALQADGLLKSDDRIVLFNTGAGLKYSVVE